MSFADQDIRIGAKEETVAAQSPPSPAQPESAPATPPPSTQLDASPPPLFTPQPVAKEDLTKATTAQPQQDLPEPAKIARATPPPLEKVDRPAPNQIAVSKPAPESKPTPVTRIEMASLAKPTPQRAPASKTSWMPALNTPRPLISQDAHQRYREDLRKIRIDGQIANKGEPGVDAVATPAGRWWTNNWNAVGQNLDNSILQASQDPGLGRVVISFNIDAEGHIHDLQVEERTGTRAFEDACLHAIESTPIQPPPPGLVDDYADHRFPRAVVFNRYPVQ
jgi:TonB family protein